ncbi:MAG: UDP-2,3-diacylglucosamine diphosphatase LpxI [Puniceicoccales bacterium]|nr:UDP-2,3-diacylglucosamine diphosphatase LpxI [Puniceicoccales bacterium]
MPSCFLPVDFDLGRPVAVLAGKGRYPELLLERLRAASIPVKLVAFVGETSLELAGTFPEEDITWIKVGQLGHLLDALKRHRAAYSIMAGQITPRRLFKGLVPDIKAIQILASLKEKNADTIFGALAEEISNTGITPLDARVFLDDQLATPGSMTSWRSGMDFRELSHGIRIAKECARLNIGQGVVVCNGTTIAVEAFEGTDKMLRRCIDTGAKNPLFVKTVKPRQDYRFDVPCFGLQTLESMEKGGVRRAALEASSVLLLDKADVIARARELGITLYGYTAKD